MGTIHWRSCGFRSIIWEIQPKDASLHATCRIILIPGSNHRSTRSIFYTTIDLPSLFLCFDGVFLLFISYLPDGPAAYGDRRWFLPGCTTFLLIVARHWARDRVVGHAIFHRPHNKTLLPLLANGRVEKVLLGVPISGLVPCLCCLAK